MIEFKHFLDYLTSTDGLRYILPRLFPDLELEFNRLFEKYNSNPYMLYIRYPGRELFLDIKLPEDQKQELNTFVSQVVGLIGTHIKRFEGLLIEQVLMKRLEILGLSFQEINPIDEAINKRTPDLIVSIDSSKIIIEIKTRHLDQMNLYIEPGEIERYRAYCSVNAIDNMFILHIPYLFDIERPNFFLDHSPWYSPSTESAFLIPLDVYTRRNSRQSIININEARRKDLLYQGWQSIRDNFIAYFKSSLIDNEPDSQIECANCHSVYQYRKDCDSYTLKRKDMPDLGICYACIDKWLGTGVPVLLSDRRDIILENFAILSHAE